jgi:hypothetical protein
VNHWLQPGGLPDPSSTAKTNSEKVLTARLQQCITTRQQLPNAVAVNFTSQGDLYKTVRRFNAAIARQSGVTAIVSKTVEQLRAREGITDAELRELKGLHRLPKISEAKARALLGPMADSIPTPRRLGDLASPCPAGTHAASRAEIKAAKKAAKASPTTTEPPTTVEPGASTDDGTTEASGPTTTTSPVPEVRNGCARDH